MANAVLWIEQVLLGSVATTAAVIAVAGLGFAMLQGRLDLRRGAEVVLGCFILFAAPVIARGLADMVTPSGPALYAPVAPPQGFAPRAMMPSLPAKDSGDPYAGASVPM